jgi:hypothetical protein
MTWELLLGLALWALWAFVMEFYLERLLRRAVPRRFTIRYLLLATTALALFMAAIVALIRR